MKYSKTQFNERARKSLIEGAREVYKAVSTTLGARGRNVVIWKKYHTKVIHDGVKTAIEINPKDPFKDAGASILKQAAQRQVDEVGDGTTVAVVLGYAIASEALKIVESGVNPMALRGSLEKGKDLLVKRIAELSKPVKTKEEKIQVATISSEDEELGKMIGETYEKAGVEAVITAEQVTGPDTFIEHQEGMQIDSGYKTEYFITNPKSMTATVTKPRVLVTDYKLDNVYEMIPLLNNSVENKEMSLVVIAEDIEGNVLATLIKNKMEGRMQLLAVKAPSFQTENVLQDIATVVGAKFISSKAKMDLKEVTVDDLGFAERITSTKDATVIIGGGGKPQAVKERIKSLKEQLKDEDNGFQKEKLKERLARLTGGVYVVKVGGNTEVEAEERKERVDDAILATKAAIEGGIIPGGEVIFLSAREVLKPTNENEDYAYRILNRALEKPFNKLVENAGYDAGEMRSRLKDGMGIDVTTGELVDLVDKGIVDPAKVAKEAIRNAVSVAVSLITSDAVICEYEEKD